MPTDIFIYAGKPLGQARGGLEDDLDELLGDSGEVTGGGAGQMGWNIDLRIEDDRQTNLWVERLTKFLRERTVPQDTYLVIVPEDHNKGGSLRVDIFPKDA